MSNEQQCHRNGSFCGKEMFNSATRHLEEDPMALSTSSVMVVVVVWKCNVLWGYTAVTSVTEVFIRETSRLYVVSEVQLEIVWLTVFFCFVFCFTFLFFLFQLERLRSSPDSCTTASITPTRWDRRGHPAVTSHLSTLCLYIRGPSLDVSLSFNLQATIGIDFLSKTMYLEDRTVSVVFFSFLHENFENCTRMLYMLYFHHKSWETQKTYWLVRFLLL